MGLKTNTKTEKKVFVANSFSTAWCSLDLICVFLSQKEILLTFGVLKQWFVSSLTLSKRQVVALGLLISFGAKSSLGEVISRLGGPKKWLGGTTTKCPVAPGLHSKPSNHTRHSKHSRLGKHSKRSGLSSSEAGGRPGGRGSSPTIGLKSMQKRTFLVLLRPIFAPKIKIAPLNGIGDQKLWRSFCDLNQKSGVLFSGLYLKLVGKTDWISAKTFFFFCRRSPNFDKKSALIWFKNDQIWVKFVYYFSSSQKSPPPPFANSWLRAWSLVDMVCRYNWHSRQGRLSLSQKVG